MRLVFVPKTLGFQTLVFMMTIESQTIAFWSYPNGERLMPFFDIYGPKLINLWASELYPIK
jgi:hypothetical protein